MLKESNLARTDLNLLVLFDVVLNTRHVGRAADRMNLTPSAVSHGLGRLRRLLNDPLFLRTPKGVVPTTRAMELAAPIADILARARNVIAIAEPFDPAASTRRLTIGAPDAVSAVALPPLLRELRRHAPGIDVAVRQVLPTPGEASPERAWRNVFEGLEARAFDVAVIPSIAIPARFDVRVLYQEDFVVAARADHPFAKDPSLERYCETGHVLVSLAGDPYGFVDQALAKRGRSRRIALTVPGFLFALSVVAETDLICALPRKFVGWHGARFGVVGLEAPLRLPTYTVSAIASKASLMDTGLAWFFDLFAGMQHAPSTRRARRPAVRKNDRSVTRG